MTQPRRRVLLIEDESAIADAVVYALETEGFEAVWCSTGVEGLHKSEAARFDLVILDIGLPDASGFDIYRQLQQLGPIPVIFLTARSGEIDRVAGLEMGADDYVVKPFSPRELTARVRAVLRRLNKATPPSPTTAFLVDEERLRISYLGHELDLSRYEYRLLKTLVDAPGRVFSRAHLLQCVWEHPEHSLERTVDTHIKTVRAKLRAVQPDQDPIKTRRGLGYYLSVSG